MHNIKLTTEEVFELIEVTRSAILCDNDDKDLHSAYRKLSKVKMPVATEAPNYDYEPPMYG